MSDFQIGREMTEKITLRYYVGAGAAIHCEATGEALPAAEHGWGNNVEEARADCFIKLAHRLGRIDKIPSWEGIEQ